MRFAVQMRSDRDQRSHRHARRQSIKSRLLAVNQYPNRETTDDLGEIAGRVVWRDYGKLGTARTLRALRTSRAWHLYRRTL